MNITELNQQVLVFIIHHDINKTKKKKNKN